MRFKLRLQRRRSAMAFSLAIGLERTPTISEEGKWLQLQCRLSDWRWSSAIGELHDNARRFDRRRCSLTISFILVLHALQVGFNGISISANLKWNLHSQRETECRFHLSLVEVLAHVDYILAFLTLKIAANFAKMPQAEYLLYLKNEIFCLYFTYFHSTGYHLYILFS